MESNLLSKIRLFSPDTSNQLKLVYTEEGIMAGFPNPASDYFMPSIDLNEQLINHPRATLVIKVTGDFTFNGINEGDTFIVDTSLKAKIKDLVLCIIDGEIYAQELTQRQDSISFTNCTEFTILGVITYIIRPYRALNWTENDNIISSLEDFTYIDKNPPIDLNRLLVRHPASTFYSRVAGNSLRDVGIDKGDVVVIDKSLEYCNKDIAVCYLNGGFTLKFIEKNENGIWLTSANPEFKRIKIEQEDDLRLWGVVTSNIKKKRMML